MFRSSASVERGFALAVRLSRVARRAVRCVGYAWARAGCWSPRTTTTAPPRVHPYFPGTEAGRGESSPPAASPKPRDWMDGPIESKKTNQERDRDFEISRKFAKYFPVFSPKIGPRVVADVLPKSQFCPTSLAKSCKIFV